MTQIKDSSIAKKSLLDVLGTDPIPVKTEDKASQLSSTIGDPELRKQLQEQRERRQYMGCGRPKSGTAPKEREYIRRTYLVNREKADKLEEIALKETLFLKEILDHAIDLVLEEYEAKGKIGGIR